MIERRHAQLRVAPHLSAGTRVKMLNTGFASPIDAGERGIGTTASNGAGGFAIVELDGFPRMRSLAPDSAAWPGAWLFHVADGLVSTTAPGEGAKPYAISLERGRPGRVVNSMSVDPHSSRPIQPSTVDPDLPVDPDAQAAAALARAPQPSRRKVVFEVDRRVEALKAKHGWPHAKAVAAVFDADRQLHAQYLALTPTPSTHTATPAAPHQGQKREPQMSTPTNEVKAQEFLALVEQFKARPGMKHEKAVQAAGAARPELLQAYREHYAAATADQRRTLAMR